MGVTISHAIGIQNGRVKSTLDRTQKIAEQMKASAEQSGIPFTIRRPDDFTLLVDMGGCETLCFAFQTIEQYRAKKEANGWDYADSVLPDNFSASALSSNEKHLANWPEQRLYWSSDFCKTQFADSIAEHRFVAELVRSVAQYADYAHVNDEGDYYHTGEIADAEKSIAELGAMINGLGMAMQVSGWNSGMTVVQGKTKIKQKRMTAKQFTELVGEDPRDMGITL